jgi:dihydrofolate reductase
MHGEQVTIEYSSSAHAVAAHTQQVIRARLEQARIHAAVILDMLDGKDRELVLGRRTYQIFEAYWPYQPDDHPIAKTLNAAKKYVASRTLTMLHWNNSTLLHGDVVSAIIALKAQPGLDLQMIGSGNLIQTLQAASLIDEYNVWTFPVVLGRGKRLFSEAAKPSALRLVRSQVSTTGVVMSTYVRGGDIQPGSFPSAEPSEKELARRKKMANEMW